MSKQPVTRRQFLKTGAAASVAAGAGLTAAKHSSVFAAPAVIQAGPVNIRLMTPTTRSSSRPAKSSSR